MVTVIALRRISLKVEACVAAVDKFDSDAVDPELAEVLLADFLPTDEELVLLKAHVSAGNKLNVLDEYLYEVRHKKIQARNA